MTLRILPILPILVLLSSAALAQSHIHGQVVDAETGAGIPYAHIIQTRSGVATATNGVGEFHLSLPAGDHTFRATAVGYRSIEFTVGASHEPVIVRLEPSVTAVDEVVVRSTAPTASDLNTPAHFDSTEDLLARVTGVDLIQRGAFAWEPAIRGMQAGQIGMTIDGMQVYGACVDKMDPATSYVEPENLARVEISRGASDQLAAPAVGGSLNLVTARPVVGNGPYAEIEVGGATGNMARRIRGVGETSHGRFALRLSGSYRGADDFAPGGEEPIPLSGYEKRNAAATLAYDAGDGHALNARFLLDDAWFVGYPALLMDATLAQARIAAVEWTMQKSFTEADARFYRSRVDHQMDDRFRDVMQREVMHGMYMPMAGNTETWGFSGSARHALNHSWTLGISADVHHLSQYGDMEMISLYPGIPDMFLLNVGDARTLNTGLAGRVAYHNGSLSLRTDIRLDAAARDLHREDARDVFSSYGDDLTIRQIVPGISLLGEWKALPTTTLRASVARAARLPSLTEHYGHYVYNYVDGFFYNGDPGLKPETSFQAEVGADHVRTRYAVRTSVFVNQLNDYIAGVEEDGFSGSSAYQFRKWANVGRALMWGAELSSFVHITSQTEATAAVNYTWGHRYDIDEPMAQIAPLSGTWLIRQRIQPTWVELEGDWAMPQNRAARQAAGEAVTDGFHVFNLRAGVALPQDITLRVGVENVLDTWYRRHTAIGQLPSFGRQFTVSINYAIGG